MIFKNSIVLSVLFVVVGCNVYDSNFELPPIQVYQNETLSSSSIAFSSPISTETLSPEGCNAVAFAQDPNDPTLLYGRRLYYSGATGENPADECSWRSFRLSVNQWNPELGTIKLLRYISDSQIRLADGRTVSTAYDPTVVSFGGERLIAFECHGPSGFGGSVGACVGPLDSEGNLIPARTVVVVDGVSAFRGDQLLPSASVPKLVADGNTLHLYWTQVRLNRSGVFQSIKTWGARLHRASSGIYWVAGSQSAQHSNSPLTKQVYGANTSMADISQVIPFQNRLLVLGHVGPDGCLLPLDPVPGCYRLEIGWGSKSFAQGQFDNMVLSNQLPKELENVPVQYPRAIKDPRTGKWAIIVNKVGEPFLRLFVFDEKEADAISTPLSQIEKYIVHAYRELLGRDPSQEEVRAWHTIVLEQNYSAKQLMEGFLYSQEFAARWQSLPSHEARIKVLYRGLLYRNEDPIGFAHFLNELSRGVPTSSIFNGFLDSPEFHDVAAVNSHIWHQF